MTEEKIEKLSLDMFEKASEQYSNIKELVLELEIKGEIKRTVVEIYKLFSPLQIKACVTEFIKNIDYARTVDNDGFGDIQEPYLMLLLIKHFTTIDFIPNKFEDQLKYLEGFINSGMLFKIFLSFDEAEVKKIRSEIDFILDNFDKNIVTVNEFLKESKGKLENPEILE